MLRGFRDNPVFVRAMQVERRRAGGGLRGLTVRFGGSLLILLSAFLLVLCAGLCDHSLSGLTCSNLREIAIASGALAAVVMPIYLVVRSLNGTFGAFTLERERQTYDSLVGSRLDVREIAAGKMLAGVWPVWREFALAAPLIVGMGMLGKLCTASVVHVVLGFASVPFFAALGLWASARSRTTQQANRTAALVTLMLFFGGPLAAMAMEMVQQGQVDRAFQNAALVTSPLVASVYLCEPNQGWILATSLNLALYLVGGVCLYLGACRRLRRV